MASCSNLDSLSRKPQCPVTCRDGVIRPPRDGAPSCGTRQVRWGRSVLAKQVGHHTSFLLYGSRDLSGASRRCGIASLAGLSSYHRPCIRCGRVALPIVLIGAIGPRLRAVAIGLWPVDGFRRIARGRHRDGCRHSQILHDRCYRAHAPRDPHFLRGRLYCTSATNNALKNE